MIILKVRATVERGKMDDVARARALILSQPTGILRRMSDGQLTSLIHFANRQAKELGARGVLWARLAERCTQIKTIRRRVDGPSAQR